MSRKQYKTNLKYLYWLKYIHVIAVLRTLLYYIKTCQKVKAHGPNTSGGEGSH